nr:hypothetical protein [Kibdelosporangium sp. MJ126-NF4]CEL16353.1 hypothetical protein [Kibdelosporangium sp. MJ126-NF4]CTQ94277.1 hypothetical protein [Kibdelosporangium sp. MJ126-NF4]
MRIIKAAATIGATAAMFIGIAGASSAAPSDFTKPLQSDAVADAKKDRGRDAGIQSTDGHSFLEVNNAGQLVRWTRADQTFGNQVRGWGWENTRQITSLDADTFVEIKGDNRLSKWTWNGGAYVEAAVGTGWNNAKVITGIAPNRFLEINLSGELVLWQFEANNGLTRWVIGNGWHNTRTIAGKDDIDFLEIKANGKLSEWYDFLDGGANLKENAFAQSDFTQARLIVGTDFDHFLVIANNGDLVEFSAINNEYVPAKRGQGWTGTRLIG